MEQCTQRCDHCKADKPLEDFHRWKNGKLGRQPKCKACRAQYHYAKGKPRLITLVLPGFRWCGTCRRSLPNDVFSRKGRRCRECAIRKASEWVVKNNERARSNYCAASRMRRARQAGAAIVERVDRAIVYERDGGICNICGEAVRWEEYDMDHVVPLSRGGDHSYANVAVSHASCNRRKHARID